MSVKNKFYERISRMLRGMVEDMNFYMSKKSRLCRKIISVLSCMVVLLAMTVISPVETRADNEQYIMMDIVVYYNDTDLACYDYVVGEQLKITEPGTYTMTFDCATALEFAQKDAGVTGLNNIGAIYLIDDLVFNTVTPGSIVNSFDFTYDRVVIDGTEVELSNHDERSGLKSMGQIDTNGPINAWDDCQLAEGTYEIEDFVLNFVGFENPQVIEITFTITNMEFKEAETTADEETTEESTEEPAEEKSTEETTEEITEASAEETAGTESTAAEAENNNGGNNTMKIVLVVVIVIVLLAVIILVVKKLKQ